MTTEDAKSYLSKRDIPRLFESLMTGLMYHRPQDHIKYLIDCLQKVHEKGQENITWSSFVDIRRNKTPLPPISNGTARPSSKGSRPSSRTKTPKDEEILTLDMGNFEDSLINRKIDSNGINSSQGVATAVLGNSSDKLQNKQDNQSASKRNSFSGKEEKTPREKTSSPLPAISSSTTPEKVKLPDIPVIIVMGAPGSGKDRQVDQLLKRYPGFEHLNVGKLIKDEIQRRGEAHAKWKLTRDLLSRGEAAPEDVTIDALLQGLKKASSAKGIVITGYPRNMEQVGDYARFVSRIDVVFIIDCDESKAMDRLLRKGRTSNKPEHSMTAVTNRMNYFKAHTLPAAKCYDDQGKLVIIEGDGDDDQIQYKFGDAFDKLFFSKHGAHKQGAAPPKSSSSSGIPEPATYKKKEYKKEESFADDEDKPLFVGAVPLPPVISEEDTGRKPDLPQCPIIFVAGGPGSGKGTQCQRIVQRYPDFVHISMGDVIRAEISTKGTADDKWGMISTLVSKGEMAPEEVTVDLLKEQLKKHSSAKAFIIEGFPRDKNQVEAFNKHIGGLNFVILFDCEEYYMQTRLLKRGRDSGRIDDNPTAISNRLNFYKYNTLPVMKYFDDAGKLVVRDIADLDADRDMESMFYDISQMFDFAFFGRKPGSEGKKSDDERAKAALQIKAGFQGHNLRSLKKSEKSPKSDKDKGKKSDKDKAQAAMQIKAGFQGLNLRHLKKTEKSPKTDDDKLKAKDSSVTYMTEVKTNKLDDETAEAAMRIKAGFEGGKQRQKKILTRGASYSSKHDSDKQSVSSDTKPKSDDKSLAASQIHAALSGLKQRTKKDKVKPTGSKNTAGSTGVSQLSKEEVKKNAGNQIAAALKGMQTRKKHGKSSNKQSHSEEEQKEAAERIQAGFRGYQTRQELGAMLKQQTPQDQEKSKSQEEKEAAERIQAGFRGFQTRKEFEDKKEQQGKQDSEEPVKEEVVEETITQDTAKTTGDNVENPSHTKKLDEAAES